MIASAFFLILIVSTALLLGNEFSIGFFIHPSLDRANDRNFLPAVQVFARFFGKIMPNLDGGDVAPPSAAAVADLAVAGQSFRVSNFLGHSVDHHCSIQRYRPCAD